MESKPLSALYKAYVARMSSALVCGSLHGGSHDRIDLYLNTISMLTSRSRAQKMFSRLEAQMNNFLQALEATLETVSFG